MTQQGSFKDVSPQARPKTSWSFITGLMQLVDFNTVYRLCFNAKQHEVMQVLDRTL